MNKVCPRTGRIINGRQKRPLRTRLPAHSNTSKATPVDIHLLAEFMKAMATDIGKIIAEELNNNLQLPASPMLYSPGYQAATRSVPPASIDIDERVIDVGIGNQASLVKGKDSATLARAEVQSDESLSTSKSKLRRLKKNG